MRTASIVLTKINSLRVLLPPVIGLLLISGWFRLSFAPGKEDAMLLRLALDIYHFSAAFIDVYFVMLLCAGSVVLIGQFRNKRSAVKERLNQAPIADERVVARQ